MWHLRTSQATCNKVIWHHMWHLQCWFRIVCDIEQSHMTSHVTYDRCFRITCDIKQSHTTSHLTFTWGWHVRPPMCYIYAICFIQSISKPARLHITGGGGHTASAAPHHTRNVMSCDLKMTSYDITCDIRMPSKGYDVQNGLEMWCHMTSKWHHMMSHATFGKSHATWTNVIWHHMWHWPPPQMSHMTSCDVILMSYDMTCALYRCWFSPSKLFIRALWRSIAVPLDVE